MPKSAIGLAALIALIVAVAGPAALKDASAAWLVCLAGLTAFAAAVGVAINGRPAGLVIDNRNRVSLSKLQATGWTLMVLSAFMTAVIFRIGLGLDDPAAVELPQELLAAMGLSAASLVGAPLVLSVKTGQPAPAGQAAETAARLGESHEQVAAVGRVYARRSPDQARWLDMFRGEEVANAASPDLSKVQQFLITLVVLLVYGIAIWNAFAGPELVTQEGDQPSFFAAFPPLSPSLVWLIGISHAGYLAYKAVPHGAAAAPARPAGRKT